MSKEYVRKWRADRTLTGMCLQCINKASDGHLLCDQCLQRSRDNARFLRVSDRAAAFANYGGACVVCDETIQQFLTIDHINGDGSAHRKTLWRGLHEFLRKHNYPDGYQTMCWNHNYLKHFNSRVISEERQAVYNRKHNQKLKSSAFDAYGGAVCACCGYDIFDALTIDHINNCS